MTLKKKTGLIVTLFLSAIFIISARKIAPISFSDQSELTEKTSATTDTPSAFYQEAVEISIYENGRYQKTALLISGVPPMDSSLIKKVASSISSFCADTYPSMSNPFFICCKKWNEPSQLVLSFHFAEKNLSTFIKTLSTVLYF